MNAMQPVAGSHRDPAGGVYELNGCILRSIEPEAEVERAATDAAIVLAVVHHLVLTRNIPMPQAIAWFVDLAPRGLIEFVPPDGVQVRRMLATARDFIIPMTERASSPP